MERFRCNYRFRFKEMSNTCRGKNSPTGLREYLEILPHQNRSILSWLGPPKSHIGNLFAYYSYFPYDSLGVVQLQLQQGHLSAMARAFHVSGYRGELVRDTDNTYYHRITPRHQPKTQRSEGLWYVGILTLCRCSWAAPYPYMVYPMTPPIS